MAARLVSSIITILQLRGCCSRYFLTVFLDSPTSMARRIKPLPARSWPILSTKAASSAQKPHQVVQYSRRTTLPLMVSLLNFSPVVVVALKRGAGSLSLGRRRAEGGKDQYAENRRTEAGARRHRENVRKQRAHVNCFVGTFAGGRRTEARSWPLTSSRMPAAAGFDWRGRRRRRRWPRRHHGRHPCRAKPC